MTWIEHAVAAAQRGAPIVCWGQGAHVVEALREALQLPLVSESPHGPCCVTANPCWPLPTGALAIQLPLRVPPVRWYHRFADIPTAQTDVVAANDVLRTQMAHRWAVQQRAFSTAATDVHVPLRLLPAPTTDARRVVFTERPLWGLLATAWRATEIWLPAEPPIVPPAVDDLERVLRTCYRFPEHAVTVEWLAAHAGWHPETANRLVQWLVWLGCLERRMVHATLVEIDRSSDPTFPLGRTTVQELSVRSGVPAQGVRGALDAAGVRYSWGAERLLAALVWRAPLTPTRYAAASRAILEQHILIASLDGNAEHTVNSWLTRRVEQHASHAGNTAVIVPLQGEPLVLPGTDLPFYQRTADAIRDTGHGHTRSRRSRGKHPSQRTRKRAD